MTEMWERFSYYGMRALLVLYMVKYLLQPEHHHVIGLDALQALLSPVSGVISSQSFASEVYGLYTGLVYLTPLLGGWLADHHVGQRRAVIAGALLMALGHFMMASESLTLIALLLLIIGNGAFKPNISSQVGRLYAHNDKRRDSAYSIFYVGINIGAFLAPLICGTLGEELGWHYGFTAAGVGMLIALGCYLYAQPLLPTDALTGADNVRQPPTQTERQAVIALTAIFIPTTFFWAAFEQQGNTISLWTDQYTDRFIDLGIVRGDIPVTWFQALNPLFVFTLSPLIISFWSWQRKQDREPSIMSKMALGCVFVACSYLILALAAWTAQGDKASVWWILIYFMVITIGELYLSPIGLSLVSRMAPTHMTSTMMGVWLATSFIGNFGAGWLGAFWGLMDKTAFFCLIALVAAIGGLAIMFVAGMMKITSEQVS
jgi:POT family proton-dependent oligopeptide transporter